jgi:hypothetical protein
MRMREVVENAHLQDGRERHGLESKRRADLWSRNTMELDMSLVLLVEAPTPLPRRVYFRRGHKADSHAKRSCLREEKPSDA